VNAKQLFDAGRVREAEKALTAYLRDHPSDVAQRTFLFELLCFSGDFDRAEKQLSVLAQGGSQTEMGAVLYYAALHAEKTRHQVFGSQDFSMNGSISPPGILNGRPFNSLLDADPDLGARLEVYAAGAYLWIPFEHIASVDMSPPRRLRDTLWIPAVVRTGPSFEGKELGEVMIPAIYPYSWKSPNESAWLGRITEWAADETGKEYPSGQKLLIMDDEEVPILEIRSLEFSAVQVATPAAS
jgi:type VI secretion system protein ImpE